MIFRKNISKSSKLASFTILTIFILFCTFFLIGRFCDHIYPQHEISFIPSDQLKFFTKQIFFFITSIIFISILILLKNQQRKATLKSAFLLIFFPILMGFLFSFCILDSEPFLYFIHSIIKTNDVIQNEDVVSADFFGPSGISKYGFKKNKRCINRILLKNSEFLWQRIICTDQPDSIAILRNGGKIKIYGNSSVLGTFVFRYEIIKN